MGDALGAPFEGLWSHSIPDESALLAGFGEFEGYPPGHYTQATTRVLDRRTSHPFGVSVVRHRSVFSAFVLAVLLGLFHAEPALAAKAIEARIEQDGKVILKGVYTGGDRADAAEIWEDLSVARLKAVQEIPADPSDPQQATLTGEIRIVVSWGRNPIASAQVDKLRLVRTSGTRDQWHIPREEVERTAQAAGLQLHTPVRPHGAWIAGGILVRILVGGVVWLVVRNLRRQSDFPEGDLSGQEPRSSS